MSMQSVPSTDRPSALELRANAHGFSLHAAVRWGADQRKELEHLCRYITRPAIANERLKRNRAGDVVLQLKSTFKDGTTHIVMSPLEFMQRLARAGAPSALTSDPLPWRARAGRKVAL
jgi:Putative transposase